MAVADGAVIRDASFEALVFASRATAGGLLLLRVFVFALLLDPCLLVPIGLIPHVQRQHPVLPLTQAP